MTSQDEDQYVDCNSATPISTGSDSHEFMCDSDSSAYAVKVDSDSDSGIVLAEVVIVGFLWNNYPCYKGYYSATGTHSTDTGDCAECDNGFYQSEFSSTSSSSAITCTQCDRTTLQNLYTKELSHKQEDTCQSCAVPLVIINDTLGTCVNCAAGTEFYASGTGDCDYNALGDGRSTADTAITVTTISACVSVNCLNCPSGTYNPSGSSYFCKHCEDGSVPNDDQSDCEPCTAGTFMSLDRTVCSVCPAGNVSTADGAIECVPCDDGDVPINSNTECEACPAGKFMSTDRTACDDCPDGTVSTTEGATECGECPGGSIPNDDNTACVACDAGYYKSDSTTCLACEGGTYSNATTTECVQCPGGSIPNDGNTACVACDAGKYMHANHETCEICDTGLYSNASATECVPCPTGKITTDHIVCDKCANGSEPASTNDMCAVCNAGEYKGGDNDTCLPCQTGRWSAAGATECKFCETGEQTNEAKTGCDKCPVGTDHSTADGNSCADCTVGHYADVMGLDECKPCEKGYFQNNTGSEMCNRCPVGEFQRSTGRSACIKCAHNNYTADRGTVECKECIKDYYSDEGATECERCPSGDTIANMLNGDDEVNMKEKCESDLGEGCMSTTTPNKYGDYNTSWIKINESQSFYCEYDKDSNGVSETNATLTCIKDPEKGMMLEPVYACIKTNKSDAIEEIADSDKSPEEKAEILEELTNETTSNGIGDVEAVANVLETITLTDDSSTTEEVVISEDLTVSILNTVSNLVVSDLELSENNTAAAAAASSKLVEQIKTVAKTTTVKNKPVTSSNVAVVSIKQDVDDDDDSEDAPNQADGIISFTLQTNDLTNMTMGGSSDSTANTILLIETKDGNDGANVDMSIVLITDSTLMPDVTISVLASNSDDDDDVEVVKSILTDLAIEMDETEDDGTKKTYVNSMITEVTVENADDLTDFKLNLYMKPTTDIGGSNTSLSTDSSGKRLQVVYLCAKYNSDLAKWEESCDTVYDKENTSAGVLCMCTHNTSFAVLMSAYEIDRGYATSQTILTHVLLAVSTIGLLLTLVFLLPAKSLRTTRSSKINICFTISLLAASVSFIFQDILVKSDDSGVIKLKSAGCAAYAMIQHYLWLVVFLWMVIEGFLMYLSLVQVFGSHISKYMLKFNLAAWGIPIPLPLIGYFAFTKHYSVGEYDFTEHGYLADSACFIRSESVAYYTLFLAPLILVILVNLVFFALVVRVIKNSKSSGTVTEREQQLRQLKAAIGVTVLLGTGWFFGIFMSLPEPTFQVFMQYFFILINSAQGFFVFLFYIVLNDQVKTHWLVKLGLQEQKRTGASSAAGKTGTLSTGAVTKATVVSPNTDNIYENANATAEEHTYASAEYATADKDGPCEFPAKSDDNTNANI